MEGIFENKGIEEHDCILGSQNEKAAGEEESCQILALVC